MTSIRFWFKDTAKVFALALALTLAGTAAVIGDAVAAGKDMKEAGIEAPADPVLEVAAGKDMKEAGKDV